MSTKRSSKAPIHPVKPKRLVRSAKPNASSKASTYPIKPKHFDWFMGLLYLIGLVGFFGIALLFIMLFTAQPIAP